MINNTIPIIMAANDQFIKPLATTITSILTSSNKSTSLEFNILTTSITAENQEKLKSLEEKFEHCNINFIDMKRYLADLDLSKFINLNYSQNYLTQETFFRFYIPELFPQLEKILYLDSDLVVTQDIESLFNEDISEYYAGVIEDVYMEILLNDAELTKKQIKMKTFDSYETYLKEKLHKKNNKYFNAGVILINLKKFREDNIIEKCWKLLLEESPFEYLDQDILNSVIEAKCKYLDYRWNVSKDFLYLANNINNPQKANMIIQAGQNPWIIHYVSNNKPWSTFENCNYNYTHFFEWWKYFAQTPFWTKEEHAKLVDITKIRVTQNKL